MRVLFMTNIPSPYRGEFFNELGKLCDLTVAFEGKSATDRDEKWKAAVNVNYKAIFMNGIRTKSDQFLCTGIIKILRQGFDKIIVGGYSTPTSMLAIEYMRLHKIPFSIEADGGLIETESTIKYRIKKHFISAASSWLSTGKTTDAYFVHYGAKPDRIFDYPFTSLHTEDIQKELVQPEEKHSIRKKIGLKGNRIVLAVGQFIPRKGFDVLLRAWHDCPQNWTLCIVGDTPTQEYLNLQQSLKLDNVLFKGFMSKTELQEYYRAADLFVLPTREDIWGLVINEAMAEGLPIVTTDHCVAGLELVRNGNNGYIVPVNDPTTLAEKIRCVLSDEKTCREMQASSLKRIRRYTIENMAYEHFKILQGL